MNGLWNRVEHWELSLQDKFLKYCKSKHMGPIVSYNGF